MEFWGLGTGYSFLDRLCNFLHELFYQFISWTNWVNSGKCMDNCWISCQRYGWYEKVYNDFIIINLYKLLKYAWKVNCLVKINEPLLENGDGSKKYLHITKFLDKLLQPYVWENWFSYLFIDIDPQFYLEPKGRNYCF